ncbi:MAG: glycosyltransferase family 39 protein [Desulfobacteraceae bacterium]|nr:glycosyltransferase family 39 protein [Desulfobacteraceae bacterium]
MLFAFVLWGALILDVLKNNFLTHLKNHAPALLLAIFLMALIFHISPPKFKILADETNLVSVSMAMHQNKTVSMPLQGLAVEYYPFDYDQTVGSRPLLYPFIISLFHALLGYSPYNGMMVNFFSGIGILFLLYLLFFHMFSIYYGIIAMIIMASFPIFVFWVTSSGFETINLFFIMAVLLTLFLFLKHKDVKFAELVLISLVLLSNCRYESIIFFFSLIILVPCFLNREIIEQYRFPTFCMPLFFLPMAWQRQIIFFYPYLKGDNGLETYDHIFGMNNFLGTFSQNVFTLTGMNADFGFLPIIFIAAVAGIYLAGKKLLLNPHTINPTSKAFGLYISLSGMLLFGIYSSFIWGNFTMDVANRMAMSMLPFIIIPAAYCIYRIFHYKFSSAKKLLIFLLLVQMLYYWPVAAAQRIIERNASCYLNERVIRYLYNNHDMKNEKLLIISDRPNFFIIHGIGSIGFRQAVLQRKKIYYLTNVYYDQILVLQKCNPYTNELISDNLLDDGFRLQKIARINVSPEYYIRISEASLKHTPFHLRK